MLAAFVSKLRSFFSFSPSLPTTIWEDDWSDFLKEKVHFYAMLEDADRLVFNQRVQLFLAKTRVESGYFDVTDEDKLLVAASAIIPVWGFPNWHYFNIDGVFLLPSTFNDKFECGKVDSIYSGMVGTGPMSGKMALSKPALYLGFENSADKHNVGIHEFVHLIDMADGECDGYPERLKEHAFSIPWFELAERKIARIQSRESNIREYGATNRVEFFAVASEYFFERPKMMKVKHPRLFQALAEVYQQDLAAIAEDVRPMKNAPCVCGSGRKYKRCCMPAP